MKFTHAENKILSETYRRLNYFHKGNLSESLLMLAYPNEIKSLIEKGLFKCYGTETKRVLNWYNLTDEGKKLFAPYSTRNRISDKQNSAIFNGERVINFSSKETVK